MKILGMPVVILSLIFLTAGCSPSFWGGTGTGAVGAGAAYEVHASQEVKKLDEDLKAGRIDQKEYDIRRDQIKRDSLFQ